MNAENIFKSNGVSNCLFQMKAVSPCHVILEQWAIGVCLRVNEWASERHIAEILDKSTIKCNHVFTLANKQRACGSLEKTNNNFNVVIQK